MEASKKASDAQELEIADVLSAEPLADAPVEAVAQAETGVVVAVDGFSEADVENRSPSESSDEQQFSRSGASVADQSPVEEDRETQEVKPHQNGQLQSVLQSMLFVASEPLTSQQMAEMLELEEGKVESALHSLAEDLELGGGLQLARMAGGYQLCTRPEYADYCSMILQPAARKLSKAALETLAVVAYRQPCTSPEVEAVRGVNVDGVMRTLLERGMIKEAGKKKTPGRPRLYVTTPEFLEYMGLNDLSELPDIDELAVEQVKALEAEKEQLLEETAEDGQDAEAEQPEITNEQ